MNDLIPLVVYDNNCYLCIKFAKIVRALSRGKVNLVGHYSPLGEKLRKGVLDEKALDMFWFIDKKVAYGGRAALLPLFKTILTAKKKQQNSKKKKAIEEMCETNCKSPKAVFVRSASLLSNSRKIKL